MKKKTLALLLVAGISLFSGTAFAAGWNVNSRGQQVYQNDDGSVVQNSWIKINQNGQSLWYYATGDGSLKQDGWLKLQEAFYYFDGNGNKWSVNAGGVITLDEGLESAELLSPKVTELD